MEDQTGSENTENETATTGGTCGDSDSSGFKGTDEQPILVTAAAVKAIKAALAEDGEEGDGLRVSVIGGGCSGYQYDLNFEKETRMGDLELHFDGVRVIIDPISAGYLKGTVVDFVSGLQGQGFKFNNPNAKRTCGCGSSFS